MVHREFSNIWPFTRWSKTAWVVPMVLHALCKPGLSPLYHLTSLEERSWSLCPHPPCLLSAALELWAEAGVRRPMGPLRTGMGRQSPEARAEQNERKQVSPSIGTRHTVSPASCLFVTKHLKSQSAAFLFCSLVHVNVSLPRKMRG